MWWHSCIMHKLLCFTDDFKRSTNQILLLHINKNKVLICKLGLRKLANLHNLFHKYIGLIHTFHLSYHLNSSVNYIKSNVIKCVIQWSSKNRPGYHGNGPFSQLATGCGDVNMHFLKGETLSFDLMYVTKRFTSATT
jgi:hypothetical protein